MEKEVTITNIKKETPDTKTFRFDLKGSKLNFIPGQFIMVTAQIDGNPVRRAFSLSSSPLRDYSEITVKVEKGGYFSGFACEKFAEGCKINIKGPYGHFTFRDGEAKSLLLIAAGSGIAPIRSIVQYIDDKKLNVRMTLLYSNKNETYIIFTKEFENLEKTNKNFRFVPTLTREESESWNGRMGRIDANMIKEFFMDGDLCYVCGPPAMVTKIVDLLKAHGVPEDRIKTEKFG